MRSRAPLLSPAQGPAFDGVVRGQAAGCFFSLSARNGCGRSTVLRALHQALGGRLLSAGNFLEPAKERHPLALEDTVHAVIADALEQHDTVLVDDWHVVTATVGGGCHFYPRGAYLPVVLQDLRARAEAGNKRLVIAGTHALPFAQASYTFGIGRFAEADYAWFLEHFLDRESAEQIDIAKLFRFAPKLTAIQLRAACQWLSTDELPGSVTTDRLIEYLRQQRLTSNVDLGEVAQVDLRELQGIDDVIESLEANVVVPLKRDDLARELDLTPKRGVLLVGPPGTGKTTVGRALAHRLKGKFFLIDGTVISGTREFYGMVHRIFQLAEENAPSVVFIDDSDVIFESGQEHGLYRYLLTMLDGLESRSQSHVCVMLTAMDVGNLPPALVRSGRIELWLETRLPDREAREAILAKHVTDLPAAMRDVDVGPVVEATDDFTGADLKRTVQDAKTLYAFDRAREREPEAAVRYLLRAVETVRANREKYAEAEEAARAQRPIRPPWFSPELSMIGGFDPEEDT